MIMADYCPRTLEHYLRTVSKQFPILLVTGARQVGKTTLFRELGGTDRSYVTLDDYDVLTLAKEEPALFFQKYPPPLTIDEIQYAPGLLPYIKMMVDNNRVPGLFWLTGSQQFHMMKGVSESLAGRVGIVDLLGLSHTELLGHGHDATPFLPTQDMINARVIATSPLQLKELYALIWRGSLPAVALKDSQGGDVDRDLFYNSYVRTYLQRDVRDLSKVGDEMAFLRFLRAAAARTGQLLNLADLARDAEISFNTAKNWLSILKTSGIVYLLEPYFINVTKRMVKSPKLYFLDTGLCSYLTEWSSPATLEAGAMSGAILETWILGELLKGYLHNGRRAPFYFYRDKDMKEIDLLIIQDGTVYPLEFKKSASPNRDDVKHFHLLQRLGMPIGPGGVVCLATESLPLTSTTVSIPIAAL
jgi:predicted AAA+ superfamily ATPase